MVTLDEGVWSLWPVQSHFVFESGQFQGSLYRNWRDDARDPALPGAQLFLQCTSEKGVAIVYLNPCGEDLREPIIRSIKHAKFPWTSRDRLMMGGAWPNHHKREELAKTHRILLIVSDYLGEFMQETAGTRQFASSAPPVTRITGA